MAVLALSLACATSASAVSPQFVGLNWDGQQATMESPSDWDAIQRSGTKLFRLQAFWRIIHEKALILGKTWKDPQPWEQTYDKYFQLAAERDITMLPYLYGRKTGTAEHQFYIPTEPAWKEWHEFAWTFVQRYGRGGTFWAAHPSLPYKPVTAWEVWNEPNLKENNPGGYGISPKEYAEFFIPTSKTITAAQNAIRKVGEPFDTKVLVAGLYVQKGVTTWTAEKYFGEIAKTGLNNEFKGHNSGYGLHPYPFPNSEAERLQHLKETVTSTRNYLNSYDSAAKPIWITEFGWPMQGEGLGEGEPQSGEEEQADLLTGSFNWLKEQSAAMNIEYAAWYNYKDYNTNPKWAYHCGLRTTPGKYRQAWFAFIAQTGVPVWPLKTVAFQGSENDLWTLSLSGEASDLNLGMAAGTSPGITQFESKIAEFPSGYVVTFEANTGALWVYSPWSGGWTNGLQMAPGTSPAVTALPNGSFEVAYQGANGDLYTYTPEGGATHHSLGMAPGTSPGITQFQSGYLVTFQANTGALWVYTPWGGPWTNGLPMAPETSPAVTALPNGSFEATYQGANGDLYTYTPEGGATHHSLGMAAGTSPSIAQFLSGYVVTFQANTGALWVYSPWSGPWTNGLPMAPETSPAVAALPNSTFEVAYQGANGDLYIYTPETGATHHNLGMAAGTSPSIAQ